MCEQLNQIHFASYKAKIDLFLSSIDCIDKVLIQLSQFILIELS